MQRRVLFIVEDELEWRFHICMCARFLFLFYHVVLILVYTVQLYSAELLMQVVYFRNKSAIWADITL